MKNLILVFLFLSLAACAPSKKTSETVYSTPITNPVADGPIHDYNFLFYAMTNRSYVHVGELEQKCYYKGQLIRNERMTVALQEPYHLEGGFGCADADQVVLTAINTGDYDLHVAVYIDDILQTPQVLGLPGALLEPGKTFIFTRGF